LIDDIVTSRTNHCYFNPPAFLKACYPDVATSLNNPVYLYQAQGRLEAAEPLYLKAVAIAVNPFRESLKSNLLKTDRFPSMLSEKRWTTRDRYGNAIYLTEERWEHIIDPDNHPEMEWYEDKLEETIRFGRRSQDSLNPQKYRYSLAFDDLSEDNTHIVAIVLFRFQQNQQNQPIANNYIVTAYQKRMS
jgi:tetratricopeptide (TPR) repeat protein